MSYPYPPPQSGRYSPSHAYSEPSNFPPNLPSQPPRDYHTYPYSSNGPPPVTADYRSFDAYSNGASRPNFGYDQSRDPYPSDSYDPHQPSPTYANPGPPRALPPYPPQILHPPLSPPRTAVHVDQSFDSSDLPLLTPASTVDLSGTVIAMHVLPPSHLPITKYIPVNRDDAITIHQQLCRRSSSIWYADGSSRAGEGWSAAVQWILDSGRSGSKMRGCVGSGDALDSELGGICKAVEGFQELLQHSIKSAQPISHELVVFCDSQAAIVSIDTSSRPESLRFESLWRSICSEFLQAHLTLAWIPRNSNLEGHVLADKIATVGASNSYLKKKKEGTLPEIYRRAGAGEPAPGGSTEAGPWQRGDADPSRRKSPFERPRPAPISPPRRMPSPQDEGGLEEDERQEEDPVVPRKGSLFVTHFPPTVTAKDLGILFAEYGSIVAVDVYHISPTHPRVAFVAYTETEASKAAIEHLNQRKIELDTAFRRENANDLAAWRDWQGQLIVAWSEPSRLVPSTVEGLFENLPEWATKGVGPSTDLQSRDKRDRPSAPLASSPPSEVNSPSPHKKARIDSKDDGEYRLDSQPETIPKIGAAPSMPPFPPTLKTDPGAARSTPPPAVSETQTPRTIVLPPTPNTAERPLNGDGASPLTGDSNRQGSNKPPLTNSAAEPQEHPIIIGAKTLRSQINLVRNVFVKHDPANWIAHSCLIAVDLDQSRRALQADLFATDEAFLSGRDLERILSSRGFTPSRVDIFIGKVLKVLDGIALAEQGDASGSENTASESEITALKQDLESALERYPEETREAIYSAGKLLEYLHRGKDAQEKKRLDVERRVKVLEGMAKVGEVVAGVVRFLLTENSG